MSIEQAVLGALEPIAGLDKHVFPLAALKNAVAPFVFYLQRTLDEEEVLNGYTGLLQAGFEINIVCRTYAELVDLSGAARLALIGLRETIHDGMLIERVTCRQVSPDLYETEVNLYRRQYDLQIYFQEVNENV